MNGRLNAFRESLASACRGTYGDRLVAVALFGSWARGTATPQSDIDVLVVAEPLPPSRGKRVAEFEPVEVATEAARRAIWPEYGTLPALSPIMKTPGDVREGSPLFLDMTDRCDILWDRNGFLAGFLEGLKERMRVLGSRRQPSKGGYYWEYKPGSRPRDVVTL